MQPMGQCAIVLFLQLLQANEANPGPSVLGHSGDQRKFVYNLLSPAFFLSFSPVQPPNSLPVQFPLLGTPSPSLPDLHPAKSFRLQYPAEIPLPSRSHSVILHRPAEATLGHLLG